MSVKTVQRMEAGRPVAGSSRRAVLGALDIDPLEGVRRQATGVSGEARPWQLVDDPRILLAHLEVAGSIAVELDRDGWWQARRERPWYRRNLVFATEDPVARILEIVDVRGPREQAHSAGREAREDDRLAEAVRSARAIGWGIATRVDDSARMTLYLGSPRVAAERAGLCPEGSGGQESGPGRKW